MTIHLQASESMTMNQHKYPYLHLLVIALGSVLMSACNNSYAVDCIQSVQLGAWVDTNENGVKDAEEQPLPDVEFTVRYTTSAGDEKHEDTRRTDFRR